MFVITVIEKCWNGNSVEAMDLMMQIIPLDGISYRIFERIVLYFLRGGTPNVQAAQCSNVCSTIFNRMV